MADSKMGGGIASEFKTERKSPHKTIYEEDELLPETTVKKYLTVRTEGSR